MSEKKDFLCDTDNAVFGTVIKIENATEGYKKIKYRPLNSTKIVTYPSPISEGCIFPIRTPESLPGTEKNIIQISGSVNNPVLASGLNKRLKSRVRELEEENNSLKMQLSKANIDVQNAKASSELYNVRKSKTDEATKNSRQWDDFRGF